MKHRAFALFLAAVGCASLHAQDTHHGPVVYPAGSEDAPSTSTAQPGLAPDTNTDTVPAAPAGNPNGDTASTPDAQAAGGPSVQPAIGNPAINPLAGIAGASSANGKADDIQDIRPPFFYLRPLIWLWVLLGVLVLAALAVLLWYLLKPLRERRAQTAYELALEKLERARALLSEENAEPYAVLVSETVRTYLGQRFHTPSTRRTTEEFLRQMQTDAHTPLAAHADLLRGFLEACDLVKFAHYQPGRDELEQVQQRAVSFVTATRPLEGVPA
jgi:hypothetical protein